jgi:hypothetical protein
MNLAPALLAFPMDKSNNAAISNYPQPGFSQIASFSPHHDIIFSAPNSVSADAFLQLPLAGDRGGLEFHKLTLKKQYKSFTLPN